MVSTRELGFAFGVAVLAGLAHWLGHAAFGDPSVFNQAGVVEAGLAVFIVVAGAMILLDDD